MNPGEIVISGQLLLAIPIAALAGLVSFASPCVLPLVPGYLAYVGGASTAQQGAKAATRDRARLLLGVVLFVTGFSVIFTAYGFAFGSLGQWLVAYGPLITQILGAVVILMGLVFIGQVTFLQRTFRPTWTPKTGLLGAPLLGVVFGIGWAPCVGPTLVAIQSLSFGSASPWRGALLSFVYCLGLGIPFVILGLGATWATKSVTFLRRHIRAINIIGGILLILIGILMVTGVWTSLISMLAGVMPYFVPAI
ncbi:cytochrome c biogenesis CcdA family protein [Paramicrobacterium agarici]|uniref:cytochrome c biogenesis CcdA family protein n=1 Tax=Paramicrobacterium agarici TaxID=630514 RepID=UPI0011536B88|nr:cytochrome c biogenesis protein CcdA [Microbacterium agarici]TQO22424.1 cytochrome c-type biogenesis protein [Microbacterium agarici]